MIERFRALGWEGPIEGPDHPFMKRGKHKVKLPNPHGNNEVDVSLLKKILHQAQIDEDQWMNALLGRG